ncbi:MAG: LTA synthase family protein, partial [Prevotellaceae bacterium]|nr:LTA synthase family protein [Prevotellaceae bacterium]
MNRSYFPDVTFDRFFIMLKGGFQFDMSALIYTNLLYLFLQIIPFRFRHNKIYRRTAKWVFIVVNSIT